MSSELSISARGLSKAYRVRQPRQTTTIREALIDKFRRTSDEESSERFWALEDVSFDVRAGDILGVIGKNGAGKSTLLKVLSRITAPTRGTAELRGRVGTLLEVGTGFHPELTGRENVFLNGAVLGMRRAEIRARFDEIVAFAEVERFIDTPVKRYSSGMYVRLAFSVAAHLQPDVLFVDEVLAVGDAAFQRKCLTKMDDVGRSGRTVLFVSHNMAALASLCTSGLLLERGRVVPTSSLSECISRYTRQFKDEAAAEWHGREESNDIAVTDVVIEQKDQATADFVTHEETRIRLTYELASPIEGLIVGVRVRTATGTTLAYSRVDYSLDEADYARPGRHVRTLTIPPNTFGPGFYAFEVDVGIHMLARVFDRSLTVSFINVAGVGLKPLAPESYGNAFWPNWGWA
jgi:lipopolysaccharide transport system ATP-binding protein